MSTEVRRLKAIPMPLDIKPASIDPTPPRVIMIAPGELHVDAKYQRELSDRSMRLIQKMVKEWSWSRFKPPVAVDVDGQWHLIDGQHTAIGALSHGGIPEIPVLVIEAGETIDRAQAFIGHNRDRVQITNTQIFFAAVAAGDLMATTAVRICDRVGATILKNPSPGRAYRVGEVVAVASVVQLIKRRGEKSARIVMETLVTAKAAPISADLIRAVEYVLFDESYGEVVAEDIASTILRMGHTLAQKAGELAIAKKTQRWRTTAIVLYQNTRKRRGSDRAA